MHILFIHRSYPGQFGHIAEFLVRERGWRCTFMTEEAELGSGGVHVIHYRARGGATSRNHPCSQPFEDAVWRAHAVYEALKARPDLRPDLIVGQSGFGSTLFLRELYDCPIVNYFEYFYRPRDSDLDFRPDFPPTEMGRLRVRARNAMQLLDLDNCETGYSPTQWQRDRLPAVHRSKVRVLFDGVDTHFWRPCPEARASTRLIGGLSFPPGVRLVTYAARGLEAMRGFDIFMRLAKKLSERRSDVVFLIAGADRVFYGNDERVTGQASFKNWVLAQDQYDLSRFVFLDWVPQSLLAQLLAVSDLHVYLTVPFVLSWSLFNALACGATVLASDTAPVREVIEHGKNGLLSGFFDVDGLAEAASRVLDAPEQYRALGEAGMTTVRHKYSFETCLPPLASFFQVAARMPRPT
jgi:glycosyltransferase involved in cell wall biosynthesis